MAGQQLQTGYQPKHGTPTFRRLAGAAEEGEQIAAKLGVTALTGAAASKQKLAATPPPGIIHLATHGFWLDRQYGQATGTGLAFAGANLKDGDGILTAEEIAHLDLRGTRLVVASACDTGLGTVRDAEGAFGIQRGFAIAGAHAVVSSLWNIPDRATAAMMISFYDRLADEPDPGAALAQAQAAFAASGRPAVEWGAFICHGVPSHAVTENRRGESDGC